MSYCVLSQVFQQYVQYVREKQGVSQAEEDLVAGLTVSVSSVCFGEGWGLGLTALGGRINRLANRRTTPAIVPTRVI